MSTTRLRRGAAALLTGIVASAAQATLITFEERAWVDGPDGYAWYADPLGDDYAPLGVDIVGGYLRPANWDPTFTTQHLLGGPTFSIRFTDTLPTYVRLSFTSPSPPIQATVWASGPDGYAAQADTGGFSWDGDTPVETPYRPHSVASFHSASGIAQLDFSAWGITRTPGKIDNLYFGNVPAVPEPGALVLAAAGLGVLGAAARRQRRHRGR